MDTANPAEVLHRLRTAIQWYQSAAGLQAAADSVRITVAANTTVSH